MLPKANRLKKNKDFEKVFKHGKKYVLPGGKIYLKIVRNNFKNSRFAFVASKEFSKKALIRNKAKRKLREIVKARLSEIKKGIDGAIVALPGLEIEDLQKLGEEINKLFKKAGILN